LIKNCQNQKRIFVYFLPLFVIIIKSGSYYILPIQTYTYRIAAMKGVYLLHQNKEELDFEEIVPLFTPEQAKKESERCLYCYDAPCMKGCPAEIDIPHFIQAIRSGNLKRAAKLINRENPFGAVCGRVCPAERLCQENCTAQSLSGMPIEINRLQAYAMENGKLEIQPAEFNKEEKIAVIGAGPAGLACARELVRNGYRVTVFESKQKAGGMVAYGVPQYRCPHDVTAVEVENIEKEGVEIQTKTPFNKDVSTLLKEGYSAVFVAVGLTKTSRPDIPGLDLQGVYMGLDFLNRIGSGDPPPVGKRVITVGGGDTALDCARSALRLGAEESTLIYRRSFTELPATQAEIDESLNENIIFRTLTLPIGLIGDEDKVLRAIEVVSMKLGPTDATGRRRPKVINDSTHRLPCNTIIFATGFEPSKLLLKLLPTAEFDGVYPMVDPGTMQTSVEGIFCGGDVSNGGATVVEAVKEGKIAAHGIIEYLEHKKEAREQAPVLVETPEKTEDSIQDILEAEKEKIDAPVEEIHSKTEDEEDEIDTEELTQPSQVKTEDSQEVAEEVGETVIEEEPAAEITPEEEPAAEITPEEEPVAEEIPEEEPVAEEIPEEEPVAEEIREEAVVVEEPALLEAPEAGEAIEDKQPEVTEIPKAEETVEEDDSSEGASEIVFSEEKISKKRNKLKKKWKKKVSSR
jgi:NADPH-dependent glutamate synthase beta subunit-like oxidoreductase